MGEPRWQLLLRGHGGHGVFGLASGNADGSWQSPTLNPPCSPCPPSEKLPPPPQVSPRRRSRWCGRCLRLEHIRDVTPSLLQERHALLHPVRLRLPEQEVIEELVLVDGPVLLVVAVAQAVRLAVVDEHVGFLPEPPQRAEELD